MKILVVDDIESNRKLLRVTLEAGGHAILEAADGRAGLAVLGRETVDAIISDILMPGMDGYRLCHEVRRDKRFRDIPLIIYTSTYTSPSDEKFALELGADRFVRKPARGEDLLAWLQELKPCAHPRPRVSLEELAMVKEYNVRLVAKLEEKNADLVDQTAALRALAARLESVREEERTRIAREIHDELGQMLTGLKMDLRWVERKVASMGPEPERTAVLHKIGVATALADTTISSVQKIAAELRPGVLDGLGLAAALRYQARAFEERSNITCRLDVPDAIEVRDREVVTAVFRIFQEILTNVLRHAEAQLVDVRLEVKPGNLVLEVSDDGLGISPAAMKDTQSLGLLGMRERVRLLGGGFEIHGDPGRGTTVMVTIPLERTADGSKRRAIMNAHD